MRPAMLMTDLRERPWLERLVATAPPGILWYDEPPPPGMWLSPRLWRYHARYQDMAQTLGPRPLLAAALETT